MTAETGEKRVCILTRSQHLVNTDPMRRCYNGCHFSSELQWGPWEVLERMVESKAEDRLAFWKNLNDYAVSARGESARREFKIEHEEHCDD